MRHSCAPASRASSGGGARFMPTRSLIFSCSSGQPKYRRALPTGRIASVASVGEFIELPIFCAREPASSLVLGEKESSSRRRGETNQGSKCKIQKGIPPRSRGEQILAARLHGSER